MTGSEKTYNSRDVSSQAEGGFSDLEEKVLNRLQRDIPLTPRLFDIPAAEAGVSPEDLLSAVRSLRERGVVRNISAVLDAGRLGYQTSLVALEVREEDVDEAAGIINAHPGVSHNYLRDHRYNIWFTLAVEGGDSLDSTAAFIAARCRARDYLLLRNRRLFKIGLRLPVGRTEESAETQAQAQPAAAGEAGTLSPADREALRLLQRDLPLAERPLAVLVREGDSFLSEELLAATGEDLKARGIIRRYAGVLRHRDAGYRANAMTVWKPGPETDIESAAGRFARVGAVSHLYLRDVYPGRWEYPLFAMIHARSEEELEGLIRSLARETGIGDYLVLRSLREFKKQRVRYFSEEFSKWKRNNHD